MPYDWFGGLEDVQKTRDLLTTPTEDLSSFDKARQAVGRGICNAASSNPGQFLTSTTGTGLGIEAVCRPYWDSQGDSGPSDAVPIQGGQCEGVSYRVSFSITDAIETNCTGGFGTKTGASSGQPGPISGGRIDVFDPTPICGGQATGGRAQFSAVNGNGQRFTAATPSGGLLLGIKSGSQLSISCTRTDGQPDTCGDAPGFEPGTAPTTNLPLSGGAGTGLPWEIGSPIKIGPGGIVLPPLSPIIPIRIEIPIKIGDIPITFNLGGGSNVSVPPKGFQPQFPGDRGIPSAPTETGAGGEAGGEDTEKYLVGVKVEVVSEGPNPNVRVRGDSQFHVGAIVVEMGAGDDLAQAADAQFFRSGQFFYAQEGANKWRVVAYLGYNLRVTPYYREIQDGGE